MCIRDSACSSWNCQLTSSPPPTRRARTLSRAGCRTPRRGSSYGNGSRSSGSPVSRTVTQASKIPERSMPGKTSSRRLPVICSGVPPRRPVACALQRSTVNSTTRPSGPRTGKSSAAGTGMASRAAPSQAARTPSSGSPRAASPRSRRPAQSASASSRARAAGAGGAEPGLTTLTTQTRASVPVAVRPPVPVADLRAPAGRAVSGASLLAEIQVSVRPPASSSSHTWWSVADVRASGRTRCRGTRDQSPSVRAAGPAAPVSRSTPSVSRTASSTAVAPEGETRS